MRVRVRELVCDGDTVLDTEVLGDAEPELEADTVTDADAEGLGLWLCVCERDGVRVRVPDDDLERREGELVALWDTLDVAAPVPEAENDWETLLELVADGVVDPVNEGAAAGDNTWEGDCD